MRYNSHVMLDEIQKKRDKMIETANRKGYTNDDTVRYSQELDQLIFEYQCYTKTTGKQVDERKIVFKQMMMVLPQVYLLV